MCIYLYRACYLKGFFSYQPDSLSYFRFLKVTPSMESLYTEKIKTQSTEQHRQKKKKKMGLHLQIFPERNYQTCLYLELSQRPLVRNHIKIILLSPKQTLWLQQWLANSKFQTFPFENILCYIFIKVALRSHGNSPAFPMCLVLLIKCPKKCNSALSFRVH